MSEQERREHAGKKSRLVSVLPKDVYEARMTELRSRAGQKNHLFGSPLPGDEFRAKFIALSNDEDD